MKFLALREPERTVARDSRPGCGGRVCSHRPATGGERSEGSGALPRSGALQPQRSEDPAATSRRSACPCRLRAPAGWPVREPPNTHRATRPAPSFFGAKQTLTRDSTRVPTLSSQAQRTAAATPPRRADPRGRQTVPIEAAAVAALLRHGTSRRCGPGRHHDDSGATAPVADLGPRR